MRKVLHICAQAPDSISGGGLVVYQSLYALKSIYKDIDYIGPNIKDDTIKSYYSNIYYLDKPITVLQKAQTVASLHFDRMYYNWKKLNLDFSLYDLIYIEFTKMDYTMKDLLRRNYKGKVIVRGHNVEQVFYPSYINVKKSLIERIKYHAVITHEKYMAKHCSKLLTITQHDKLEFEKLYSISGEKIFVVPVGIKSKNVDVKAVSDYGKIRCIITGSLWFGPNYEAIKWFLREVYDSVADICTITIAGAHPIEELKEECIKRNINLIDTPKDMEPYLRASDLLLAPIFAGSGMKVKIAEAMSYGLPVITTNHGSIGYEKAKGILMIANTSEEFGEAIIRFHAMSLEEKQKIIKDELKVFSNNYSLEAITHRTMEILQSKD